MIGNGDVLTVNDYNRIKEKTGCDGIMIGRAALGNPWIFKSIQYHPVTEKVLHIDLYGIKMDKPVNIKIPVQLTGNPIGIMEEGGVLNQASNEIEIQCLPADIPEFVETDISKLNLGDSISVGIIGLDEKFYELLTH